MNDPVVYTESLENVIKLTPWRCLFCKNYPGDRICSNNPWGRHRCDKWALAERFLIRKENNNG